MLAALSKWVTYRQLTPGGGSTFLGAWCAPVSSICMRVQTGADADLVVFDPETIEDTATYEQPHRFPRGIDYVLVGGQIAVDHGLVTSARAGKVLRRP